MIILSHYGLMTAFPDFKRNDFDERNYNQQFKENNILIHAKAQEISFSEHWGPLSIKTAFNGSEFYKLNRCEFAVNDLNYMVINEGTYYSSYISADQKVESFTINFSPSLVNATIVACRGKAEFLLDNFREIISTSFEVSEQLHEHDNIISPYIFKLKELSCNFRDNLLKIEELHLLLIEKLIFKQQEIEGLINDIPVLKTSTKRELYKRLMRAKDFIDSCYYRDIRIAELASVCFLNETYFLRQFKNYFGITPRQYLIQKRIKAAKELLEKNKEITITEVCHKVGYNDLSSFSKLFKNYYSISPEFYRRFSSATSS